MHIIGNNMALSACVCVSVFLFMFTPLSHTDTQVVIMNDLLFYNKHAVERRAPSTQELAWLGVFRVAMAMT